MATAKRVNKCLFFLLFAISCSVLLTGCDLIDIIKKFINGAYRSSTTISILVYPPLPIMQEKKDYDNKEKLLKAFSFSESAKRGLMNGVEQFNQVSDSTEVIPIFYKDIKPVLSFYKDIFENMNDSTKIKKICRNKIFDINDNSKYKAKCIIFGIFEYKESSTAYNIILCYYDYALYPESWTT